MVSYDIIPPFHNKKNNVETLKIKIPIDMKNPFFFEIGNFSHSHNFFWIWVGGLFDTGFYTLEALEQ